MWIALGEYRGQSDMRMLLRYVMARYNRAAIERSYRSYVTDSLSMIPRMTYYTTRWVDLIYGYNGDNRTAEEIIEDVAARLEAE